MLGAVGLLKYVWPVVTTVNIKDKNKSYNNSNKFLSTWKSIPCHYFSSLELSDDTL